MRQIPQRKPRIEAYDHEELFLRYYQQLFGWALRLTGGPRARAEDLLHDAFIQFVICRPDLSSINSFDRYLYRLLLNLFLAQKRKAAQMQYISLNITDYDSAELGLHVLDFQARWQAQEDLLQICHYACVRKETSRAGSVLILRFFYDYSPSEIARVTLSPRRAIDDWLRLARREARLYLEDPGRLKFMAGEQGQSYRFKTKLTESSDDIVRELRASILRSCQGDCFSKTELNALYQGSESGRADKSIDCSTLGHIVSCAHCLDQINQLLGLPPLSARYAIGKGKSDPDETDKDDADGTGTGIGPSKAFINRCRGQLRQVMEHRPEELHFSANGSPIGALKINSELSELQLSIHDQSPLDFIEVFSERGMRLILFSLEHGEDAPVEQRAQIELSEGRTLELSFKLGDSWPSLHVIYHDPLLQEVHHAFNDEPISALALVCEAGPSPNGAESIHLSAEADVLAHTAGIGSERLITRLSRRLRGLRLRRSIHSELKTETSAESDNKNPRLKELRAFELGRAEDLIRGPLWERPLLITVFFSVWLIAALVYLWMPGTKTVTAAGLLERARIAEDEMNRNPDQVQHRTLGLEERRTTDGRVISKYRIEDWQSAAHGVKVSRLYDDKNRLIAGEWRKTDGTSTLYRNQRAKAAGQKSMTYPSPVINNLEVWRRGLSAKEFAALIKQPDQATIEETSQVYIIKYHAQSPAIQYASSDFVAGDLVMGSLTLRRADLHVLEQKITVQRSGEGREFHFIELQYERPAAHAVSATVFQPEAELMSAVAIGIPAERIHPPNSPDRASPSTAASAELEVEAAYLLSRVKADLGEQVGLERTGEGRLQIVGIVGTETRKDEILQSLGSLVHNPAVEIDIATEAEARRLVAQRATAGRVIVREVVVSSNEMPAHQHLRRYFAATEGENSSTESIDRNIREFAAQALKRASKALGHASALRRLVNQLPQDKVRTLTLDARSKWELMISEHARACHLEVKALREALEPIFFYDTGIEKENRKSESIDNASLAQVVEDLLALCRANDVITGAAFTISNKATRTYEFSTPQFWQSLRKAEALAKIIEMNEQYSFGKNSRQTQP